MPYQTPWGEERPTKDELAAGTRMAMAMAGVDVAALEQEYAPGEPVSCPAGIGQVEKCIGKLYVVVKYIGTDKQEHSACYPKTKLTPATLEQLEEALKRSKTYGGRK